MLRKDSTNWYEKSNDLSRANFDLSQDCQDEKKKVVNNSFDYRRIVSKENKE